MSVNGSSSLKRRIHWLLVGHLVIVVVICISLLWQLSWYSAATGAYIDDAIRHRMNSTDVLAEDVEFHDYVDDSFHRIVYLVVAQFLVSVSMTFLVSLLMTRAFQGSMHKAEE